MKSTIKWLLLLGVLLSVVLVAAGCVSGLAPIGWSGGTVVEDALYVGSEQGRVVAVDLSDESRQWSEAIQRASSPGLFGCDPATSGGLGCGGGSAGVPIYGDPVVFGELVYIAGYNGKIYAYNRDTLDARWVYPREGYLESFVGGMVESGGRLFAGGSDGVIYALDAATGDRLWTFVTGDKIWASGAVEGDTLYIGSFDNTLYALNTADGGEKWRFATGGAIMAMPLVDSGTVYIGSFDRSLYALDAADGSLRWQFTGENWFWARPVPIDGKIYAGCLDGNIYVIDAAGGAEITRIATGAGISSNPVVIGDRIIFANREGNVLSVDTSTDRAEILVNLESPVYGPLTAADGIIYIHLQNLTLQRVNADTGALLRAISLEIAE